MRLKASGDVAPNFYPVATHPIQQGIIDLFIDRRWRCEDLLHHGIPGGLWRLLRVSGPLLEEVTSPIMTLAVALSIAQ